MAAQIEVDIAAPMHVVWEVMTDVAAWPTWTASVTSVEMLGTGPLRIGSAVRIRQPKIPPTVWTVTDIAGGRSFTWEARGPGTISRAMHAVRGTGPRSCRVRLTIEQTGPVGRTMGALYARLTDRYLALEANGLKARCEGDTVNAADDPGYPGDFIGMPSVDYAPSADGEPDPGEIVWTWVPYEEDHRQGKDRPVLLIGHDGDWLLALCLTSKDHDRDERQERAAGRHWIDIGSGAWDRRGRASEVRVDRILRVAPDAIRREGAVLAPEVFASVITALRTLRS